VPCFSGRKSPEEVDVDHARGLKRDLIAHLAASLRRRARCNAPRSASTLSMRTAMLAPVTRVPAWLAQIADPVVSES
jgi:hypothetical protein